MTQLLERDEIASQHHANRLFDLVCQVMLKTQDP
jgi:hypothetical protein